MSNRNTIEYLLTCEPFAESFEAAHPWCVYDAAGHYDSRFSNEKAARTHAHEIGGSVEQAHCALKAS